MSSFRMRPHPRSNILDVFAERQHLNLTPVYQRISGVWDHRKQQLFIDSIINGVDLPKIYFHELIPPREVNGESLRYAIIDGKQRLEAIWSFVEDKFGLANDFRFFDDPQVKAGGEHYSTLATKFPLLRSRFDRTDLPIVTVQTDDEELVENLFSRLNEAVPLTAPEYRNTLGGPLPRLFRELATHGFFQSCLPFETGRHRYLDLAAKFVYIVSENRFASTKKTALDEFVRQYQAGRERGEIWARQEAVKSLDTATRVRLDAMEGFFEAHDPLLNSIGWVTLYFHLFRLLDTGSIPDSLNRSIFEHFVGEVAENRRKVHAMASGAAEPVPIHPEFAEFDRLRHSLNDGSAIRARYTILRRFLAKRYEIFLPEASDQPE